MNAFQFGAGLALQFVLLLPTATAGYLWGWTTGLFVYFCLLALRLFFAETRDAIITAIRMGPLV